MNVKETEKVGFCPHESAYIYPIVRPNNDCQFIAYLCDDYEDFEAGKCADDSKPIELNFDFYDNPSHGLNASEGPNNLFIKTGASYPYCLFHYQIIVTNVDWTQFNTNFIHSFELILCLAPTEDRIAVEPNGESVAVGSEKNRFRDETRL